MQNYLICLTEGIIHCSSSREKNIFKMKISYLQDKNQTKEGENTEL